ncbi:MAG TPA: UDP-N-acetylglucosamine 1-carboxyvinyltransferase [Thermomicrobiales bacterium]|jgi:UDP-N-acetylglucosamine 1-carboxyvinyltransferase|nr:UDP-N-acetylglucosamine 1-carboxyvinyltransferase [Thermomicrobiales bacterium]
MSSTLLKTTMSTSAPDPLEKRRALRIRGGNALRGEVTIGGAKNAALPLLAATLLTSEPCVLNNVPTLSDMRTMALLLESLGARVEYEPDRHRVAVEAATISTTDAPQELVAKMRASFLVAGPLLARCGHMSASTPGGCQLGVRPVDVDVRGFRQMGAQIEANEQFISGATGGQGLRGAGIYMDYPSHTGTENLLMAATLANGRTTIVNASCEPEIVALGTMLNRMGARITGLGSPTIVVEGVDRLHGVSETILPDRLEAGTYAIAAAVTGGEVQLNDINEPDMLPIRAKLEEAGAEIWTRPGSMLVRGCSPLKAVEIQTMPFPGFPTDLQAAFAVLMTQANGVSKLKERVFEDRLKYTDELNALGADISVERLGPNRYGNEAIITGPTPLHGTSVRCHDIRAGAGMVLAGLIAAGETEVRDIYHIDRGYERMVPKLQGLGADIDEVMLG